MDILNLLKYLPNIDVYIFYVWGARKEKTKKLLIELNLQTRILTCEILLFFNSWKSMQP